MEILDVDAFKPLLKGTDLAKALNTKPGPWMRDALDIVMAWQLRNPDATDPAEAIEAVKASRSEKNESELPSRLASHFLQLTIPPFFPQNKPGTNTLEASRQPKPWKESGNQYILDLLEWSIRAVDGKTLETQWRFLVPPILMMIDDIDVEWKARGCHLLGVLLDSLNNVSSHDNSVKKPTSKGHANFLQRTGYHNVFAETLLPLFTYIPSLTPEQESVELFRQMFPAITSLALLLPTSGTKDSRDVFFDKIIRDAILSPLAHFPTPSTYPELATTILHHLRIIVGHMGIEVVKHLPHLIPLLSAILQEPFALGHRECIVYTLLALQSVMLNGWPRIAAHRGAIMMGLCLVWGRCLEEGSRHSGSGVDAIQTEVKETAAMLDAVMQATEEAGLRDAWEKEKLDVMQAATGFEDIFGVPAKK